MQGIRATVVGNLTADPEVRQVNGKSVANFDIAVNDGYRDKVTGEWVEKGTSYIRAAAWAGLAEHVGETLSKGDEVLCTGSLTVEQWESDGKKGTTVVLTVTEIGVSLRWAVAEVKRVKKGNRAPFIAPGEEFPPAPAYVPASTSAPF